MSSRLSKIYTIWLFFLWRLRIIRSHLRLWCFHDYPFVFFWLLRLDRWLLCYILERLIYLFCSSNHCCFITVDGPDCSILVFPERCMLKIEVRLLFFPSMVTVFYRPNPCWSVPLVMIAEDIFVMKWWRFLRVCSCCSRIVKNPICTVKSLDWAMFVSIIWRIVLRDGVITSWRLFQLSISILPPFAWRFKHSCKKEWSSCPTFETRISHIFKLYGNNFWPPVSLDYLPYIFCLKSWNNIFVSLLDLYLLPYYT